MPTVELTRSALRELERLPADVRRRFVEAIEAVATGGHAEVKKLKGTRSTWRLRVGEYRGIYEKSRDAVVFTRFAHRSHVYDA